MTHYYWTLFTVAVYVGARALYVRRPRLYTQPIIVSSVIVIGAVLLFASDGGTYTAGSKPLSVLLTPATICLAVPLYRHAPSIKRAWRPTLCAILVGAVLGLALPPVVVFMLNGPHVLGLTLAPKSATTPIAMEVSRGIGGNPPLTALFTVLTGLLGSIIGVPILRLFGLHEPRIVAVSMGVSAHAIGTAHMLQTSPEHGSFAAFAMTVTGILTALLSFPLYT